MDMMDNSYFYGIEAFEAELTSSLLTAQERLTLTNLARDQF
jgi:hypothetical protein